MKRAIGLLFLILVVATFSLSKSSFAAQNAEKELRYLEYKLADAIVIRDVSFLGYIYADGFVQTDPYLGKITKGQLLARIISNADRVSSIKINDLAIQFYGNTAIVTGRIIVNGQMKESASMLVYKHVDRFTHTYVKMKGKWRMVAAHLSSTDSDK